LRLSEKQINAFLFAAQGVGAVFVGIFLAAYLAGLPTTAVFHSEPAFRIPLTILGAVLLIMVLSASVLAVLSKKD
jgi:F0F1-type ATP synthase assembly protein I